MCCAFPALKEVLLYPLFQKLFRPVLNFEKKFVSCLRYEDFALTLQGLEKSELSLCLHPPISVSLYGAPEL